MKDKLFHFHLRQIIKPHLSLTPSEKWKENLSKEGRATPYQKMPSLKTRPCRRRGDCLCGVTEIRAAKSLFYRLKVIERGNSSMLANAESEFEMRVKRKRKSCSSLHQKLYKNLNLLLFLFSSWCSYYSFSISLPTSDFSFILINSSERTTWISAFDWFCCLF